METPAASGGVVDDAEVDVPVVDVADPTASDVVVDDDHGDAAVLFDGDDSDDARGDAVGGDVAVVGGAGESSDSGDTDADDELADIGGDGDVNGSAVGDAADGEDGAVDDEDADDDGGGSGVRFVVDGFGGVLVEGPCGGVGPVCPVVEGVAPIDAGGRLAYDRLREEWGPWVGRVLDLCDDHEALAALNKEWYIGHHNSIDYGAVIPPEAMAFVLAERERHPIVCSDAEAEAPRWKCWGDGSGESIAKLHDYLGRFEEPPESSEVIAWAEGAGLDCWEAAAERLRYVYMTTNGPLLPQSSVEAAVADYLERLPPADGHSNDLTTGRQLGSVGGHYYPVETPADAVVVLPATVSVIDGVLRGLAQNQSDRLWARDVTVTATDTAGGHGEWRFPLTVQPGETMPFEIENLAGAQTPADLDITITADLSSTIDLTRSLELWDYRHFDTVGTYLYYYDYPEEMGAFPYGTAVLEADSDVHPNDDNLRWVQLEIRRSESTAHPRLAEAARQQTIENLTVYAAILKDGTFVEEVWEMTPMTRLHGEWIGEVGEGEWIPGDWIEMRTIPTQLPDDPIPVDYAIVGVVGARNINFWAGGAAPGSGSPGDEPQ